MGLSSALTDLPCSEGESNYSHNVYMLVNWRAYLQCHGQIGYMALYFHLFVQSTHFVISILLLTGIRYVSIYR